MTISTAIDEYRYDSADASHTSGYLWTKVEHLYSPRAFAGTLFDLVEPGGIAVVSTPYHGYFKNLTLAVTGKLDSHFTVLWDHGHIKFWSVKTLNTLLMEAGFREVQFQFAGRFPLLAKSMIAVATRP